MKRLLLCALSVCLLLTTGCSLLPTSPTAPTTQTSSATTTTPTTQTTSKPTTASTAAPSGKTVTVYLLEKSTHYNGKYKEFYYDEQHNLSSSKLFDEEKEVEYTVYFEKQDENGMPYSVSRYWSEYDRSNTLLSYTDDGKIQTIEETSIPFKGYKFEHDDKGRLTSKSYVTNNHTEWTLFYEYSGNKLTAARCIDENEEPLYEIKVKNGNIVKEIRTDETTGERFLYNFKYDKHGNRISKSKPVYLEADGTTKTTRKPADDEEVDDGIDTRYQYKAVKVPVERAPYILEQQKFLSDVT